MNRSILHLAKVTFIYSLPLWGGLGWGCSPHEDSPWVEGEPDTPEQPTTPGDDNPGTTQSRYNEPCRPQIHYTPAKNWVNDPNGMFYKDGTWHLYYQHNPYGNDWGNMSWGHATSTDLMHWQEQPLAIVRGDNTCGDIFSGSCVIDHDNVAGFGRDAVIAFFTGAADRQQQCIAYSTDDGQTFTVYGGNPVIANTTREHFRDPKVMWHEPTQQWIMSLALGTDYGVEFYGSRNLKDWTMLSQFRYPSCLSNGGIQWECPDLIQLPVLTGKEIADPNYQLSTINSQLSTINSQLSTINSQLSTINSQLTKWLLIVSVNPGGPNGGSGTMYFIGDFDGTRFTADPLPYPLWIDTGADNYAGVTYHNAPDNRLVMLGWMNNWMYCGASPVSPWRSAFTLPRDMRLVDTPDGLRLASVVSPEIERIAGQWADIQPGDYAPALKGSVCSQLHIDIPTLTDGTITLSNSHNEQYTITINRNAGLLLVARGAKTGHAAFHGQFALPAVKSTLPSRDSLSLDIYIDQSSVEIFSADGLLVQTNTVYPTQAYHIIHTDGIDARIKVRPLTSVWQ